MVGHAMTGRNNLSDRTGTRGRPIPGQEECAGNTFGGEH